MERRPNAKTHFETTASAAKNPYIGFTSYQSFRGDPLFSDVIVRPENNGTETEATECYPVRAIERRGAEQGFYPDTEVAYIRILWKDFEPRRGEYDLDLIARILSEAKARDQSVMFRLMPHSTREKDDVPEWLKDLIPCPERPAGERVKESPSDPLWLKLFGEAIRAIGTRFDGDPTLDVVDISLTGAWGEGHRCDEYPQEALERLADDYVSAFHSTRLIGQVAAPWLTQYVCRTTPCGWRGDGTGEPKHMTVKFPNAAAEMPDLWQKAPVSFESYWWLGEWARRGWNLDEIIEKTLSWHLSTFNGKSFPIPERQREKIDYWLSKMGYHFTLTDFAYPQEANAGDVVCCEMRVNNRGVAPLYHPTPLRIRLKGETRDYTFTTSVNATRWLPGEHVETFHIELPTEIAAGDYAMEISLSEEGGRAIEWETRADREEGFLVVGRLRIGGSV